MSDLPSTSFPKEKIKVLLLENIHASAHELFASESFQGERWDALAACGATTQRCLWASTSTKNPSLRDTLYIENLIGPRRSRRCRKTQSAPSNITAASI